MLAKKKERDAVKYERYAYIFQRITFNEVRENGMQNV